MSESSYFDLPKINPDELSPAVWAYIGDSVYELFIRSYLLCSGPAKTKDLHHKTIGMVRASFQAQLVSFIDIYLTDPEREIIKRGRNVKSGHIPAHTDVITYRYSTAFEALIGYLYLSGQQDRMKELLHKVINPGNDHDKNG